MKFLKNKRMLITVFVLLVISCFAAIYAAEPGSVDDPVITLGYFNEKISDLKTELQKSIKALESKPSKDDSTVPTDATASSAFKIVNLKAKASLICGEGTELIVRSGEIKAIGSSSGGLSDVTDGRDVPNNEIIKNNHHLIIPRNDGRGIIATIGGAVMVKGDYEIKENE
jgi:hypothetical protein